MRCTKFIGIISAYVDSEANSFEQLALQEHLKNCPHCKGELEAQYVLRGMVKESHTFSDNINISTSVMAAIRQKKQAAELDLSAFAGEAVKSRGWVAVALMFAITMAAVFSAHTLNSRIAVAEAEPMYSEYVYEHLSTELSGVYHKNTAVNSQVKQVSYTK